MSNIVKGIKYIFNSDNLEYDRELDEFDYTIQGDFLFDNEKSQTLFFYCHLLSVYYDNIDINLELARSCLEEDSEYFFKLISYLRDKEGLGRKKEFRKILNELGDEYPLEFRKYIPHIVKYGRYDDLYEFFYGENEDLIIDIFKKTLDDDLKSNKPSTLAKWLKSINASNENTKMLGKRTSKLLGLSYIEYRKLLSHLRGKLNVVEKFMSNNEWDKIQYGNLSYSNIKKYRNSFMKNDTKRFNEFINMYKPKEVIREQKSKGFELKYEYLKALDIGIEEKKTKDIFIKEIKEIYENLEIPEEDWLVAIALNEKNLNKKDNYYMQSVFLSNFYLCNNKKMYKDHIIKTKDIPNIKKIQNRDLKNDVINIIENSISEKISIESVFDLLLLSAVKNSNKIFNFPSGVVFAIKSMEQLSEITNTNKRSKEEEISLLYLKMRKKWNNFGFNIPKIKIWIIKENYRNNISVLEEGKIFILEGSGEKAFKTIIQESNTGFRDFTYEEIKEEMIKILSSDRYNMK
ncbi:DUF2828 family protein [Clostridium thermobutyricum]|uniref:DUF2828 family protein n=1 Tax=Clostridium thermobutyricum TaxID=29372 RepID=UPI002943E648|nr:DUF2828 family protein [Clostridium thermobutyricum]